MLRFGIDVDGVLAHHMPAMCEVVRDLLGVALTPDQVTDYYFAGFVAREEMDAIFTRCMELAMDLPPMPGYELVNELPGQVTIVTHRHEELAGEVTRLWLAHHAIRFDGIVFTRGPKSATGEFDYFVDDAPHNAVDLARAGITTFLMDYPYNRAIEQEEGMAPILRVASWHQIGDHLREHGVWGATQQAS